MTLNRFNVVFAHILIFLQLRIAKCVVMSLIELISIYKCFKILSLLSLYSFYRTILLDHLLYINCNHNEKYTQ
jgi:hypothetical protein